MHFYYLTHFIYLQGAEFELDSIKKLSKEYAEAKELALAGAYTLVTCALHFLHVSYAFGMPYKFTSSVLKCKTFYFVLNYNNILNLIKFIKTLTSNTSNKYIMKNIFHSESNYCYLTFKTFKISLLFSINLIKFKII